MNAVSLVKMYGVDIMNTQGANELIIGHVDQVEVKLD